MSLVESCPSTEMRSNERLTQTPSSRSAVSASSAASVSTKHSIVANAGEIMPAPLACAHSRTVPDGSCDLERGVLGERVGGADRRAEGGVAVGGQLAARVGDAADDLVGVERHADHAGRGDGHAVLEHAGRHRAGALHARRVLEPAAAGGGVGVAGVGDHGADAGELAALLREQHRGGEHARAREAGGAHGVGRVADEQAEVGRAGGLEPAGDAGGAEALPAGRRAARSRGRASRPSAR